VIKKIKVELIVLFLILINIFLSSSLDLSFYYYFNEFDKNPNTIFLKNFFVDITTFGDSFWYFFFCFLGIIVIFIFEKTKLLIFTNLKEIKNLCYYTIICLFFTGLLTQLLKHIVGRPRPNHTILDNSLIFDFFTFDSNFHSFPSGHTSTIFIVALICSKIIPRLKYFFLVFALLISFSRIVVGAHFLSDIIGGIIIAFLGFKLINLFLDKKFIYIKPKTLIQVNQSLFFCIIIVLISFAILLTIGPSFDIFFSSLFYRGDNQFFLQSYYSITIFFRDILLPIILVYVLVLPIISTAIPINKIYFNYKFSIKKILFVWITLIINLILIINLFFKNIWGRPRPGDILELGGKDVFSPWYQISDACTSNCSFVSGDAGVGFSLIVLYFLSNNLKYAYLSIIFGFILGMVRIAEGGHFLSDVIFSAIIVFFFSFIIKKYFLNKFSDD